MRTLASFAPSLAALLLSAAAVQPALAQQAAISNFARPVIRRAAPSPDAASRTLAVYRIAAPRDAGMPTRVTVADSAGRLVASYSLAGSADARPMLVEAFGTDVVLQGETPSGMLTLRLYGRNDAATPGTAAGHWWLGAQHGELRDRAAR